MPRVSLALSFRSLVGSSMIKNAPFLDVCCRDVGMLDSESGGQESLRLRSLSSGFLTHLCFLVGLASSQSPWEIREPSSSYLSVSSKFSGPSSCQAGASMGLGEEGCK